MRKLVAASLFALVTVTSALAGAQTSPTPAPTQARPQPAEDGDCARLHKRSPKAICQITIEGTDVLGKTGAPNGVSLVGRESIQWPTLIKPRMDMRDKLVRSADDVQ